MRARRFGLALIVSAVAWQTLQQEIAIGFLLFAGSLLLVDTAIAWSSLPMSGGLSRTSRLAVVLTVLLTQAIASEMLVGLLARYHDIPGWPALLAAALNLLGMHASEHAGRVIVHLEQLLVDIRPSLSRMAVYPLSMTLSGVVALLIIAPIPRPLWLLGKTAFLLAVYAMLRMLLLVVARPLLPENGVETSPVFILVSLLPAVWFLPCDGVRWATRAPTVKTTPAARRESRGAASRLRPLVAFAVGGALVVALGWDDPGVAKPGRILFDDSHGIWEPTDLAFDTKTFNRRNAYSYGNFYEYIGRYYTVQRHQHGPLTQALLAPIDVLILKTPTTPFQDDEVAAIEAFVRAGGGLFMIGDHTDLFGMSTFMNKVAQRFGITFRPDDTFSVQDEGPSVWRPPMWLSHRITAAISHLEFETSNTLQVPLLAHIPIVGYGLAAEVADYNNPGFFGNLHLDPWDDLGFFAQLATVYYGTGRVAAFSDSTTLSNFSLYFPGRSELALRTIAYLNHRSTWQRHIPLLAWPVALIGLLFLLVVRPCGDQARVVLALVAGLTIGTAGVQAWSRPLAIPPAQIQVPVVAFDQSISEAAFPSSLLMGAAFQFPGFDTFFVATQRLGYVPVLTEALEDAWGAALLVLAHPQENLTTRQQEDLIRFVSQGGSLLVIDGAVNAGRTTNDILALFGLSIALVPEYETAELIVPDAAIPTLRLTRPVRVVTGGYPVLTDGRDRVIYAEADIGQGRVGVLAESATLSRSALGNRFYDTPSQDQQQSFETLFIILKRLVEKSA